MYKIMGNRANVKPPHTFNQTTPAQLRGQVDDDTTDSTDVNTTDLEGSQRGKKKRRMSMHPDSQETITRCWKSFKISRTTTRKQLRVSVRMKSRKGRAFWQSCSQVNKASVPSLMFFE